MLLTKFIKNISNLKSTINEDKTITMEDLLKKIQIKYPHFNISRVHLGRVVKDLNITLKQTRLRHEPKTRHKKPISIKNELKKFYDVVKQYCAVTRGQWSEGSTRQQQGRTQLQRMDRGSQGSHWKRLEERCRWHRHGLLLCT